VTAKKRIEPRITFVSERQLAAGMAAKINWLLVPNGTHIPGTTLAGLAAL